MQRVQRIPTEFPFCTPPLLVGLKSRVWPHGSPSFSNNSLRFPPPSQKKIHDDVLLWEVGRGGGSPPALCVFDWAEAIPPPPKKNRLPRTSPSSSWKRQRRRRKERGEREREAAFISCHPQSPRPKRPGVLVGSNDDFLPHQWEPRRRDTWGDPASRSELDMHRCSLSLRIPYPFLCLFPPLSYFHSLR